MRPSNHQRLPSFPYRLQHEPYSLLLLLQLVMGSAQVEITPKLFFRANPPTLINRRSAPIDLTGWSFRDDQVNLPGFSLSAAGILQPGDSVVITDNVDANFRTAWNLAANVKVIGQLGAVGVGGQNLGRSDQINIYDFSDTLIDRLTYGDQTIIGSICTQNISGQAPCSALGQNTIAAWVFSSAGDVYA